ncbi:MAG: preprotein translocase subunit YajC [Oscillospiraceae bacterium]|nr:preprotein translocase subunit YajC [Oscillospiraceae bacterium]
MQNGLFGFFLFLAEGAEEEVANPIGSLAPTILMMALLFGAMYFFMIRPESKRKKAAAKMREELIVGDEVTTTAGIVGKIVQIKDDTVVIETGGDKTRIRFLKGAVSSKTETVSS